MDIGSHYKSYSPSTRQSLEAWAGGQLDLGLVSNVGLSAPTFCHLTFFYFSLLFYRYILYDILCLALFIILLSKHAVKLGSPSCDSENCYS